MLRSRGMKRLILILCLLLVSLTPLSAGDGKFFSYVIHPNDPPISFLLSDHQFIKITNFVQSGSTGLNGSTTTGTVYVYQGATGLDGAMVLSAGFSGTGGNADTIIAGPAVVYIPSLPDATLFITYLFGDNH